MNANPATKNDTDWLEEVIHEQFPYTQFTKDKISEKISDPNFIILVARQENILTGFIELELFFETKEARMNAIFVSEGWRDQGIAKMLISQGINKCKHKRIQRIFLLVKETNEDARALYKKSGFVFEKMHEKIIDSSRVEQWGMSI